MADPQLEVLAEEECWRLLGAHHLGRRIRIPDDLPFTWWG